MAWVPSSLEDRKLRSISLVQIPGNDVHPCPGLADFAPTTTVPRLFSFTCSSEPTARLAREFRQTSRASLHCGNSAVVDRMGKHQLNWHIRKPQYGSRRLAAKNHFVAALGEVSPHKAVLRPRLRCGSLTSRRSRCSMSVQLSLCSLHSVPPSQFANAKAARTHNDVPKLLPDLVLLAQHCEYPVDVGHRRDDIGTGRFRRSDLEHVES